MKKFTVNISGRRMQNLSDVAGSVCRGDHEATEITFCLPKEDNTDYTDYVFNVKALNPNKNEVWAQCVKTDDGDNLLLTWVVGADFTAVAGNLAVWLEASEAADGEIVYRWSSQAGNLPVNDALLYGDAEGYEASLAETLIQQANVAATAQAHAESARDAALESASAAGVERLAAETAADEAAMAQQAAETAGDAAVSAQNSAVSAKNEAEAAKNETDILKLAAEQAKSGAELAQQAAESAKSDAITAKNGAETAKAEAETAKEGSQTAQQAAETARQLAEAAKDDAVVAKNGAEAAKVSAEAAVGKTSHIGDNGNWFEWSAEAGTFVDTGVQARGEQGLTSEAGADGQDGRDGVDGQNGEAGVYYGTTQPTTDPHPVWVDPTGEPDNVLLYDEMALTSEQKAMARNNIDAARSEADDYNHPWYDGVDLTQKFSEEIAAAPYSGDPWAWIKARITAANYHGIYINDYIPFTCTNGETVKACVAGIDTYYGTGFTEIGHHIDFISRDCWRETVKMNLSNYNNGLIPVETLAGDGATTAFVMTRQMVDINTVTINGTAVADYTYDVASATITFGTAPAAGAQIKITGIGSYSPWFVSNAYAYLNSLAMHVPNGTTFNPTTRAVDYTTSGVWYYLPETLKSVIVGKQAPYPSRFLGSGLISYDTSFSWTSSSKLWLPHEIEVMGYLNWAGGKEGNMGYMQYPYFRDGKSRIKRCGDGESREGWWLLSAHSGTTNCFVCTEYSGYCAYAYASEIMGVPVCFRIA